MGAAPPSLPQRPSPPPAPSAPPAAGGARRGAGPAGLSGGRPGGGSAAPGRAGGSRPPPLHRSRHPHFQRRPLQHPERTPQVRRRSGGSGSGTARFWASPLVFGRGRKGGSRRRCRSELGSGVRAVGAGGPPGYGESIPLLLGVLGAPSQRGGLWIGLGWRVWEMSLWELSLVPVLSGEPQLPPALLTVGSGVGAVLRGEDAREDAPGAASPSHSQPQKAGWGKQHSLGGTAPCPPGVL